MSPISEAAEKIATDLGLDQEEVNTRWAFLEFGEQDTRLLAQLHGLLQEEKEGFSSAFYDHLLGFPELRALLPDMATVDRLRETQAGYFDRLTAGRYGPDYIHDRLRVGIVHQRIGLGPKWYIGAYRKYLSEMMKRMRPLLLTQPELFFDAYNAVLKIVSLDMGLALDTYFAADRQVVLQQRDYLEQIMSGMPAGLVVIDKATLVRSMNQTMLDLLAIGETGSVQGASIFHLISDERLKEGIGQVLASRQPLNNLVVTLQDATGSERQLEINIRLTSQGNEEILLLIAKDVTAKVQALARLRESEEHFRLMFARAGVGIAFCTARGRIVRLNQKVSDILGYTEQELIQRRFDDFTCDEDRAPSMALIQRLLRGEIQEYTQEKRYVRKDGRIVWANATVSALADSAGASHYIVIIEDIDQRKQAEEALLRLANFDTLTQLPNRALMLDRLGQAIGQAQRQRHRVAVILINLDRFRNINDSFGHDIGDKVICAVGRRLASQLRHYDTVARAGGDEFIVILPDVAERKDVAAIADKLLDNLGEALLLDEQEVFPIGSMGISLYPDDGSDGKTLLKNADTAMYRAKSAGRGTYRFYASEMNARALDNLKLEGALRRALEREEFVLYYQPQRCMKSGRLIGVEALIRWQPQGQQMIPPGEFIPIAEDTGLIVPIGDWILHTACAQLQSWRRAGLPDIPVHVNLSARQFQHRDLVRQIAQVLESTGCPAHALGLEITESAVMENPAKTAKTLRQLSEMGIRLAIDDFGTGYSSLSYLKQFPIDTLKIDRSFVQDVVTDNDDAMIVKAMVALGHSLRLDVVAEGVETHAQAEFLYRQDCNVMQGFHFGRPVPAMQMEALLRKENALHADS
jgi:diguanylate cyclase (GGDEF)-like protein/PAS domain S-box-containing protein